MSLTLVAVSLNDQPLSQPITAVFDNRGGTIGRADHNTMALPDPQRHVSRLQAEVVAQGEAYIIRNVGAANPIVVGARTLAHGETAALSADEQIRIGGYLLMVQIGGVRAVLPPAATGGMPAQATPPRMPAAAAAPAATSNPFGDLLGPVAGVSSDNPFADLMGPAAAAPPPVAAAPADPFADLMPPPAGVHSRFLAAPPPPPAARLPDDFDPFSMPAPAAPPIRPAADPFADLMPAAQASPSIDTMFGLGASTSAPTASEALAAFVSGANAAAAAPGSAGPPALSTDPLALFGDAPPSAAANVPQPDNVSALHDAWASPVAAAPPGTRAGTPLPPAVPAGADSRALWAAFCRGAGLDTTAPPPDVEARMHELGRILRSAVEGTLQLIAVRASTKHELRAGVTVIRQRDNNPLKFSPDAKSGLQQLLGPPLRGFLDGPAAMDDAMHDLVGHAIGTVAGLRAAVEGMLDRFAPEALESKLVGTSMLDNLLPMHRKARLWELYLRHHQAIREEAQEDFHTLFGKAFLAAYEQQIARLEHDAGTRR